MLGQLMAEALLSCYRSLEARQAMDSAEVRVQQEIQDRSGYTQVDDHGSAETVSSSSRRRTVSSLMTINEAAAVLGISRIGLYGLVARGDIPVLRMGKSVRIVPSQLEEWIKERSTKPQLERQDLSRFGPRPPKR